MIDICTCKDTKYFYFLTCYCTFFTYRVLTETDEVFGARVREMFELGNSYFNEAMVCSFCSLF